MTPARDLPLTVDLLHAGGLTVPQLRSIFVLDSNSRLVPLCDLSTFTRILMDRKGYNYFVLRIYCEHFL